jgi:peptide/nickel transport system substrate-binding protein
MADDDRPLPGQTDGTQHVHIRTFLIADVRGYTLFTQERGDEAATKLAARFADVAREVVNEHGGLVIELRGDEALAAFDSARQAILAAAHAQDRFLEETVADPSFPLPVGIGLDAGEAVPLETGYRGGALNLAARLCGRAGPGEILASQGVVHLARKVEGVRYLDRGDLHLKGLEEPVHVVRVISEQGDPAEEFRRIAPRPARGPAPVRLARRHPIAAVLVALALVTAVAVPTTIALRGGGPGERIAGDALGMIDLDSGELTGQPVPLGSRPGEVAVGEGGVWVTLPDRGEVVQIDPETANIRDTIPVGADPSGIAVGFGFVWVANSDGSTVSKISPDTKKVVQGIHVPAGPAGIAVGPSGVWVVSSYHDSVSRIDPQTGQVVATVPVGDEPVDVALDDHGVWVASAASRTVSRVDPDQADEVQQVPLSSSPRAIDAGASGIWVATLEGTVSRIDPDTNTVAQTIPVGGAPIGVALGGGSVWVSDEAQGLVARIEPGSDSVSRTPLGSEAGGMAIGQGALWVGVRGPDAAHRGGTLTAFAPAPGFLTSLDPAVAYSSVVWNILGLAHDGLIAFKRAGGLEGTTLVTNLATSIPTPTNGGKRYTFQVRPGIRYSNGVPVRPDDFRRSIERVFAANYSAGVPYFSGILGAKACEPGNACDLSRGIVADDDAGTVTFHLTEPDPEFLYALSLPFAFAVPAETPDRLPGTSPIPATGPYVIERSEKHKKKRVIVRVWLARNPEFIERPGRPDGFPDRIVWRLGTTPRQGDRQVDEVLEGSADFMLYVPNDRIPELAASHPEQLHRIPRPTFWSMNLNNQTPPFDDVLVRRAVNFAVDRKKIAALLRGEGTSTCQILPPAFPGYAPYCPYSRHPDTSWTAPDFAKSQDLIAESGTAGSRVIVWASRDYFPVLPGHVPVSRYFVRLLDALGYRATLKVVSPEEYDAIWDPSEHLQMALTPWETDYPAESGLIGPILTCGGSTNYAGFCHPGLDRRMEKATGLQLTDPVAAHRLWSRIEHDIVDLAPWVPLVNSLSRDLVSERVGNFQYSPQWGPLVDQMWVR